MMSLIVSMSHAQDGRPEPLTLAYQGQITQLDGVAVSGARSVTFRMYNAPSEGELI